MVLAPQIRLSGMIRQEDAVVRGPLFVTHRDVDPDRQPPSVRPIIRVGPYSSYSRLLKTHHDLLAEDFRRAVSEQINEIRANPKLLESASHYVVKAEEVLYKSRRRGESYPCGIKMSFDPSKYRHVQWDEEKRFLNGNLVFLSRNGMNTFHVGVVHDSNAQQLRKGNVVIKMVSGTDGKYFTMLDQEKFLGYKYYLVESAVFYFPYFHVTNALREIRDQSLFVDEIVRGDASQRPNYLSLLSFVGGLRDIRNSIIQGLNDSQAAAFDSILNNRVALVQGPPGTGKTYLGCKIAEFFVRLKHTYPSVLRGPILLVTTTNHAVHEFLSRCLVFTEKVIHGYSDKHGRSQYGALQEKYDKSDYDGKYDVMQQADLLAMTTTRAAFTRSTLDDLRIKIVIVEEAAEALEAYVLASLPQDIEHLVQIGDHKQLQPSCSHHALAASHNLDLSLFERLINNGLECPMLNEQRRMRPEIKKLVENIYPTLTNHPSTEGRPPIKGVDLKVPVFFMNTAERETRDGTGYCRPQEAKMAAELGAYLLQQGYDADKITILTTYRKQLSRVLEHLRHIGGGAKNIKATCVDNFQGEENEIIILSLVRSNSSGSIGFLKKENRACVALSRAKNGFFILGNLACLTASGSPTWRHVRAVLVKEGRTGPALPLVCPHGRKVLAHCAADVREARELCRGGARCRLTNNDLAAAEQLTQMVANMLQMIWSHLVTFRKPYCVLFVMYIFLCILKFYCSK